MAAVGVDMAGLQIKDFDAPGLSTALVTKFRPGMERVKACYLEDQKRFKEVVQVLATQLKRFDAPLAKGVYIGCNTTGDFYGVLKDDENQFVVKVRNQAVFGDTHRRHFELREQGTTGKQIKK